VIGGISQFVVSGACVPSITIPPPPPAPLFKALIFFWHLRAHGNMHGFIPDAFFRREYPAVVGRDRSKARTGSRTQASIQACT
jgi:hypothetical protein